MSRKIATFCALLGMGCALATGCSPSPTPTPNLVLVTLDTTRADHLGAYGYRRDTSPHFDALAAEATLYTRATSTSSWTLPAHASLFTGLFPTSHGAHYQKDGPLALGDAIEAPAGVRARGLDPGAETLASLVGKAGYTSAGFAAGPWLLRGFGLAQGFDHWDDEGILDHGGRRAEAVNAAVFGWLDARPTDRPFLLFVNYFDPHFPYDPPPHLASKFLPPGTRPDPNRRDQYEALYDAEIRGMDEALGALLARLRRDGLYEKSTIVLTSDHGELLGEHGEWGHGRLLYRELVRVPLLVKPAGPAREGTSDDRPIQLVDVFGLLLDDAKVPRPDRAASADAPVLAEVRDLSRHGVPLTRVFWSGDWKLHERSNGEHWLFDLSRDPRERVDRFDDDPERSQALRDTLANAIDALPPAAAAAPAPEIDPAALEALGELGYLE